MSGMRKLINIVEATVAEAPELDEKYTRDNVYLKQYMQKGEFDPYRHWNDVCNWLARNGYLEEASEAAGHEIHDEEQLQEEDPEIFYKLPEDLQSRSAEDVVEELLQHDPAEAPTWAHMQSKGKTLLPRTTWLVHFTDHPYDIAAQGFTIGIDQMDKLGLTTWFKNDGWDKKEGGYNFAFTAQSRYASNAANKGSYGQCAVLFQNSGVHAYHHGDEEDQVMFWGADVSPQDIVVLYRASKRDDWNVKSRYRLRNGETTLFTGDFESCVKWVIQNATQYRRKLK
jgi:hypothetical protein